MKKNNISFVSLGCAKNLVDSEVLIGGLKSENYNIVNDINDFVKEYGEQKGYRIIFGATGGGTIMYAQEGSDLTDEVLEELNAQFTGK